MATLRATQFGAGLISGTAVHDIYTVPADHKIIVKSVILTNVSLGSVDINVRVNTFGTWFTVHLGAYGSGSASVQLKVWAVFNAGQILQLNRGSAGDFTYVLAGSLMTI
jgi:hypothetical protein